MWHRHWLVFSQAVTIALGALFVVDTLKPQWLGSASRRSPQAAPAVAAAPLAPSAAAAITTPAAASLPASTPAGPVNLAAAARRASPAVVSIVAGKARRAAAAQAEDPRFRFFFDGDGPPAQSGLGSGVIVSAKGFLLTNNHVVEGASRFDVQLADGRQAEARLVGTDPETDLAVLKIDLERLPVVAFGDLQQLLVGDPVLAIGNPFNVGQTVTAGIVSALGRNRLGLSTFENFIQTDAAINPGNSGGALVDVEGRLVGINTAIFSRSGGSLGIGFAIPADTARQVMDSLVRDGQVRRGWIGVEPRDLSAEIARSLDLHATQGVLITGVLAGGPASQAGLRPGDVVQRVGAQEVANTAQLLATVAALQPESLAVIGVQRGEQLLELKVQVALRPRTPSRRR